MGDEVRNECTASTARRLSKRVVRRKTRNCSRARPTKCRKVKTNKYYAQIAQSVEQWTENPRVTGSIPVLGTTKTRITL